MSIFDENPDIFESNPIDCLPATSPLFLVAEDVIQQYGVLNRTDVLRFLTLKTIVPKNSFISDLSYNGIIRYYEVIRNNDGRWVVTDCYTLTAWLAEDAELLDSQSDCITAYEVKNRSDEDDEKKFIESHRHALLPWCPIDLNAVKLRAERSKAQYDALLELTKHQKVPQEQFEQIETLYGYYNLLHKIVNDFGHYPYSWKVLSQFSLDVWLHDPELKNLFNNLIQCNRDNFSCL